MFRVVLNERRASRRAAQLASILLFVSCAAVAPSPPQASSRSGLGFTVSPQTTILVEPLRPDGSVDYVAAINRDLGRGVTVQNNAAVALAPLMKLHHWNESAVRVNRLLAMVGAQDYSEHWISWKEFNHLSPDADVSLPFIDVPWTANQHPDAALWIHANSSALSILHLPTARNRFWIPLIPGDLDSLADSGIHGTSVLPEIISAWKMRILLRIGEKNWEAAWQELSDCHRLARLYDQSDDLVMFIFGRDSLEKFAIDTDLVLLDRDTSDNHLAKDMLSSLPALGPLPHLAEFWCRRQQFEFPDLIALCARHSTALWESQGSQIDNPQAFGQAHGLPPLPDWDAILKHGNSFNEQIINPPDWKSAEELARWAKQIDQRLGAMDSAMVRDSDRSETIPDLYPKPGDNVKTYSDRYADAFLAMETPHSPGELTLRSEKIRLRFRMLIAACALRAYRDDMGSYPAGLDALIPKYLPQVPTDSFGSPLQLISVADGITLATQGSAAPLASNASSRADMVIHLDR